MVNLSVCIDIVFDDIPFLERIDRVAEAGYSAFEFWFWTGKDLEGILKRKMAHGLEVSAMQCSSSQNLLFEDWAYSCLTDPQNRSEFLFGVEETVQVAQMLNCHTIIVLTGIAQAHLSPETQKASIIAGLKEAAPLAAEGGVTLALEPLNVAVDHPGYFLQTVRDTVSILREVDHPNVKMLFDIYHQQITEGNIIQKLTEHIADVAYIHAADAPGRHQPGTGELNYRNIFRAIDQTGYDGYVGLEYAPLEKAMASLEEVRAILA